MTEKQIDMMNQFISEIDLFINHNRFQDIYGIISLDHRFDENENLFVSDFTRIVLDAGLDPLKYLRHVPNFFLVGDKKLTSLKIPEGMLTIGDQAFMNCSNLQSVELPNGLQKINNYAFDGCVSLKDLKIPDSVTTIESNAFARNSSLTHVQLGSGLTEIGQYAFGGCVSLKSISYNGTVHDLRDKIMFGLDWHDYAPTSEIICKDGSYYFNRSNP